jgi:sulfatase modifying factor 1
LARRMRHPLVAHGPPWPTTLLLLLMGGAYGCVVRGVCYTAEDCSAGQSCQVRTGRCIEGECETQQDCGEGFRCVDSRCEPEQTGAFDCPSDMALIAESFCMDRFEASRPDATATSAGSDNSRATSRSGVLPWQVASNAEARAACEAAGKDLCSEQQWFSGCSGPQRQTYAYGDRYDPAICNGIDTYCFCGADSPCAERTPCPFAGCFRSCSADFGLEPTGSFPDCRNPDGVFDLNGNLWEHVKNGDATRVRGGAYNCSDSEQFHRCDYVPRTWTPSALGFRCCARPETR